MQRKKIIGAVMMSVITSIAAAGLAMGCASTPKESSSYPPTIAAWLATNQNGNYYGVGQSPVAGEPQFAQREANRLALSDMAQNIETAAGVIGDFAAQRGVSKGGEVAGTRAAQVIRGAKTVGPVDYKGVVYVIKYVSREDFDKPLKQALFENKVRATEAELNALLDKAIAEQQK